ncbi:MAG: antitoxin [Anaerolineae bacterium]|nr:antitoxin [Anaerolineae bacterium]
MNRDLKLESEEQELLDSYERDEWHSIAKLQERLSQYQADAMATFEAMGLVSIALPQEDIQAIREKAATVGMSYQALIANILHQYALGNLVEKPHGA